MKNKNDNQHGMRFAIGQMMVNLKGFVGQLAGAASRFRSARLKSSQVRADEPGLSGLNRAMKKIKIFGRERTQRAQRGKDFAFFASSRGHSHSAGPKAGVPSVGRSSFFRFFPLFSSKIKNFLVLRRQERRFQDAPALFDDEYTLPRPQIPLTLPRLANNIVG